MPKETIKYQEIYADQIGKPKDFPKYSTQIMNLANQNAQGTRPRIVGQMSDLITEFTGTNFDNWVRWYMSKRPNSIDQATNMVFGMIQKFSAVIQEIDRQMVHDYLEDLVLAKTYVGFRFQQGILKFLARKYNKNYKTSTAAEEAKGIDGFIDDVPISVKPHTYKSMVLSEKIEISIVYYEKKKAGITIEYPELFNDKRSKQ